MELQQVYDPNQFQQTLPTILCCMCGVPIPSNPSNMCVNCVRNQVDITEGIPKQLTVQYCRGCGRYLNPPAQWLVCALESKELLSLCLKRIKGLNKVKLIDAGFVWTEPHSMRLKVKLTIQKEVFSSTILQQIFIVEFVVQGKQCDVCQRKEAKDTWQAVVQLRQKVEHKRTFFYLEQLILKHNAHVNCINIKERSDGLDFFYAHRNHAAKFVDFLQNVAPIRFKQSEKLVSHDEKTNTANIKHTFSVEIVPICRDDLVCLPSKLAMQAGGISPILLCDRVTTAARLIDPFSLKTIDVNTNVFWNCPFRAITGQKQLIEYTILDINPIGIAHGKYVLADAQVVRSSDFGSNDTMFMTRTHLGRLLKPGDLAMGYDLSTANFNEADLASLRGRQLPDVVLVRKCYPKRSARHWKLKTLEKEENEDAKKSEVERAQHDFEEFMNDVEQDAELRQNLNLYKAKNAAEVFQQRQQEKQNEMADTNDEPEVGLEELLDDLTLEEEEDQ